MQVYHIWPENWPVWCLWGKLQTQWRTGISGVDGLDYPGVISYLCEIARIKPREFVQTFGCIQAMEAASLAEWRKPPAN